jgi:hypothetical protein
MHALFFLLALLLPLFPSTFTQIQRLTETGEEEDSYYFADAVATTANGSIVAIGAPLSSSTIGQTSIWYLVEGAYVESQVIHATDESGSFPLSGTGVALSSDGVLLAIGEPGEDEGVGRVTVYESIGGSYINIANISAPVDQINESAFGTTVAWCSGSSRLVVGGPRDDGHIGAIWIFSRSGNAFTELSKHIGTDYTGSPLQGAAIAVTSDCATIAIGGPENNGKTGAVWILETSGTDTWAQQAGPLVGSQTSRLPTFGYALSFSSNGNRIAIGGPRNNYSGAVWIFDRASAVWTESAYLYSTATTYRSAQQGSSVHLTPDGETLHIGTATDGADVGAIHTFAHGTGSVWTFSNVKRPLGYDSTPHFADRLAVSGDGTTFVVGARYENYDQGAAYILTWA